MTTHFLQSKEWEGFQRSLGREVFRVGGVLVVKLPLAFGKSYLYCGGCLTFNVRQVSSLAKKENVVFLKLESMMSLGTPSDEWAKSKKEVQPQKTIVLDITRSEDEILAGMHGKTRYNIRVAERHGVKFSIFQTLEKIWELFQKTAQRDGFSTHTREYYEKLLELPPTKLFTAEYRGRIIAANTILFYADTAYYLHGASDYKYRKLMAPYLLHWETIKYAKAQGYKKYDFWGIDENKWPGVTRFKRGFGGKEIEYIGSFDYVFSEFWYWLYKARQRFR
jgi:lipid II:glycine glycyltransferase (peptidoglycan interpeptide bridge formation enzyme)